VFFQFAELVSRNVKAEGQIRDSATNSEVYLCLTLQISCHIVLYLDYLIQSIVKNNNYIYLEKKINSNTRQFQDVTKKKFSQQMMKMCGFL
jgi:hypothetical protein